MKSKPVVMDHFSTSHTAFQINFVFTNNITILMGMDGKTKSPPPDRKPQQIQMVSMIPAISIPVQITQTVNSRL